jgi:hypothetical protein
MFWDDDVERDEFADVGDADELCRRLLKSSSGRRSSTEHGEAVDLLARVRGTGELGTGFVALLLCTCRRWGRATGRLIAAIESADLLSDGELDELAEAFLADEVEVVYPLAWVSPQLLEIDLHDPTNTRVIRVDEDTPVRTTRRIAPPLRRWAARRLLSGGLERLDQLLARAQRLDPHGRAAVILGLLDAAAVLDTEERRRLMRIGLATGTARVRCAALELVCELDGSDAALRRARSDPDAKVRAWRPRSGEPLTLLSGAGMRKTGTRPRAGYGA